MKFTPIALLIFSFLFFVTAIAQSEEHYIYKDAQGKLVISNQQPPAGSNVLRKFDLPEFRDAPMQQVQEISSIRSTGKLENLPNRDQKEINIDGSPRK